jgi:hypothetical protein
MQSKKKYGELASFLHYQATMALAGIAVIALQRQTG